MKLFIILFYLNVFILSAENKKNTHHLINHDSLEFLCRYNPSIGFEKAKKIFHKYENSNDTFNKAKSLYFLGKSIGNLHKYEEALKYLYYAKSILENSKKNELTLFIDLEIAKQYGKLNLYDKALIIIDECSKDHSLIINSDIKNYFLADLYSNKAFFIGNVKPTPTISDLLAYHIKASKYIEKCKKRKYNYAYSNVGLMYSYLKKYKMAIYYYNKAVNEAKIFNVDNIGIVYKNLSHLYFENENYEIAIKYADSSLKYSYKKYFIIKENYKVLSQSFKKLNKLQEASNFEKLALLYEDSLLLRDNKEIIKGTNFLIKKIEKEKNEIHQKSFYLELIIFLCILITIAIVIYLVKRFSKNINLIKINLIKKSSEIVDLKKKVKDSYDEVIQMAKSDDPLFPSFFKELYPDFYSKLMLVQPNLTVVEQKVCFYIKLKFSTKEIAMYTFVSIKAIQNRKNRLRKRLGLKNAEDLYDWIDNL